MRHLKRKTVFPLLLFIVTLVASSCGNSTASADNSNMIALTNCIVIDGTGIPSINDGVILIRGDKIEKAGSSSDITIPNGCIKMDLGGRTVMPGFINAHVHKAYDETNLKNWLNAGVTTVRDESPRIADFISFRDENNKRSDTARIISATPILSVTGGYGNDFFTSADEAESKVKDYINKNVDIIKISIEDYQQGRPWSMPTKAETKAMADAAHAGNKKVSVHITHEKYLQWAIDIGVNDLAHMVVEPIDKEICQKIIEKDIYWEPTLELWTGISEMYSLNWDKIAIENLSVFYQSGGKIALGTDFAGYTCKFDNGFPITEVKKMKEAGMSNMDIIVSGTLNAAHVCDRDKELGSLEAGKIADILVVGGKPLENIEDLQNTYMVIHNGQIAFTADTKE